MELQLRADRGSTKAVELRDVTMGFGDDLLFVGLNLLVRHGERVGLIGANGAGKSVLFQLFCGELEPLDGVVRVGPSIRIGYYAQQHETLAAFRDRTPIDLVRDIQPMAKAARSKAAQIRLQLRADAPANPHFQRRRAQPSAIAGAGAPAAQFAAAGRADQQPRHRLGRSAGGGAGRLQRRDPGISHDRYFLDRVVDRIVELEDGR